MRVVSRQPVRRVALCLVGAAIVAAPLASYATNGYFLIGYGAKTRSMGGAGIAFPQDGMAAAANPAGMTEVGTNVAVGAEFFFPKRRAGGANGEFSFQTPDKDASSPGENKSGSNVFLIPSLGGAYKFNRRMSIGMSALGNGANTRYTQNFFELTGGPYGTLGVSLIQMQMLPTIAYRMTKNHSVGASLQIGIQQFRAYGLGNFGTPDPNDADFQFSSDAENLSNRGNDYSYGLGVRVGWLGKFFKNNLNIGAYYASRTYMTKFDKYKGLFAEQGGFDIPEHFGLGVAFKPFDGKFVVTGDIQKIRYSGVKSIANSHPTSSLTDPCTRPIGLDQSQCSSSSTTPQSLSRALGADDGFGFGWKDQTVYKIGVQYRLNSRWTFRGGYNYGKSPIPDNQILFNLLATATTEKHVTAGLTYTVSQNSSVDVSYVHAFKHSQVCAANDGCQTMLTQSPGSFAAAELVINALGIAYQFRF